MGKIINRAGIDSAPRREEKPDQTKPQTASPSGSQESEAPAPKPEKNKTRKELAASAKEAVRLLTAAGFDKLAMGVTGLTSKAVRDRFTVCIVGEFNQGKTTTINKLLNIDYLPVDILPTTSLLTRITYGKENGLQVIDNKGKLLRRLPLKKESWDVIASDKDDVTVEDNDHRIVKVFLDNDWLCRTGIDVYDTPGANDGSKNRDLEISRALMIADGAVVCVDARKGITLTQEAFILDRILSPKIPFVAIAITFLDMIEEKNRDRVVASIIGKLKLMKVECPMVITSDVTMPSDSFANLVGIPRLKSILLEWRKNPERSRRIELWLATGIQSILTTAIQALEQKKQLLSVQGEERNKMIVQKKAAITDMHDEWEKVRDEIDKNRKECENKFLRKHDFERINIIRAMQNRIDTVPDPAKWYAQSYAYEISTRISASIISLDNLVTETARNDFDKLNRIILTRYKATLERNGDVYDKTPDSSSYVHAKSPDLTDIDVLQEKSTKLTAAATAVGGVLAGLIFGVGGLVGTIGASTGARLLTKRKIDKEIAKARMELSNFVKDDVATVFSDAVRDCRGRISLIYGDMERAARLTESNWMKTQHEIIDSAVKPAEEASEKTIATIDERIREFSKLSENLNRLSN